MLTRCPLQPKSMVLCMYCRCKGVHTHSLRARSLHFKCHQMYTQQIMMTILQMGVCQQSLCMSCKEIHQILSCYFLYIYILVILMYCLPHFCFMHA